MANPVKVLDLATEALALIGVYAPGETIDPFDLSSALYTLNAILDGWGIEALTIFDLPVWKFTTQADRQTYTLGPDPGNDWVAPSLPARIDRLGGYFGGVEIPLKIYNAAEWAAIEVKTLPNSILAGCWPQYGAAAHTLRFWPVPAAAIPVALYVQQQTAQTGSTEALLLLPPGYREPLTYELAIKTAPKFGAPVTPALAEMWAQAKSRLKESNFPALDAQLDPALSMGRRRGRGGLDFYLGK